MKHITLLILAIFAPMFLVSCEGKTKSAVTGEVKPWKISDNPTPDQAKDAHKELEEEKGAVDRMLIILRRARESEITQGNITACLENLAQIAEGKDKLAPFMPKEDEDDKKKK